MVDFLILGSVVAVHYDDVFPLMKDEKVYLGYSIRAGGRMFQVPDSYDIFATGYKVINGVNYISVRGVRWFTSLYVEDQEELMLTGKGDYERFDGTNYINIDSVDEIPDGYYDVMGVPLTYIDKWCRRQFEIVGIADNGSGGLDKFCPAVDGVSKFTRILIKRK